MKKPTGIEVLNNWSTIRSIWLHQVNDLLETVARECRKWHALGQRKAVDRKDSRRARRHGENLKRFVEDLAPVWRPVFWQMLAKGVRTKHKMQFIITVNPYISAAIVASFGIKAGSEGVGMMPKEPFTVTEPFSKKHARAFNKLSAERRNVN